MTDLREKYKIKSGILGTHFGYTGQKIIELRKKGKSYREIQQIIGCSKSTISYHLSGKKVLPSDFKP